MAALITFVISADGATFLASRMLTAVLGRLGDLMVTITRVAAVACMLVSTFLAVMVASRVLGERRILIVIVAHTPAR